MRLSHLQQICSEAGKWTSVKANSQNQQQQPQVSKKKKKKEKKQTQ